MKKSVKKSCHNPPPKKCGRAIYTNITRESQSKTLSPFIPVSARKSNSRPPSWRTHSITMRVGPGGEHTYSIWIVRTADPSPRVGTGT